MFRDELSISEIPEFWNDRMEQLLGVRPTKDSQGVLQDTHWSNGLFDYFPTYKDFWDRIVYELIPNYHNE
jgi:carboxypeptidase Taq